MAIASGGIQETIVVPIYSRTLCSVTFIASSVSSYNTPCKKPTSRSSHETAANGIDYDRAGIAALGAIALRRNSAPLHCWHPAHSHNVVCTIKFVHEDNRQHHSDISLFLPTGHIDHIEGMVQYIAYTTHSWCKYSLAFHILVQPLRFYN